MTPAHTVRDPVLEALGLTVLQRDWLSANHSVFAAHPDAPATVVDTGYARHSAMTLALLDHALGGEPVQRIVNTHLHADHCGGNAALQQRDPQVQTWIPQASLAAVHAWDMTQLSYVPTGQHCPAFRATGGLSAGDSLRLGPARWQVHAAPGHDPDAVMLFEPQTRTLIAGDALWEDRLAIIFPELEDQPGFGATRQTLGMIEALAPRRVVPGHGGVFEDVAAALAASRRRLDAFEREPLRHVRHAARALLMFHMMEHEHRERSTLLRWLVGTPLFVAMARRLSGASAIEAWAADLVDSLLDDGLLADHGGVLSLAASPSR
jgi:glyoxylase-like metal-dependent hydrolase (beta-lactamase superfamily II)